MLTPFGRADHDEEVCPVVSRWTNDQEGFVESARRVRSALHLVTHEEHLERLPLDVWGGCKLRGRHAVNLTSVDNVWLEAGSGIRVLGCFFEMGHSCGRVARDGKLANAAARALIVVDTLLNDVEETGVVGRVGKIGFA